MADNYQRQYESPETRCPRLGPYHTQYQAAEATVDTPKVSLALGSSNDLLVPSISNWGTPEDSLAHNSESAYAYLQTSSPNEPYFSPGDSRGPKINPYNPISHHSLSCRPTGHTNTQQGPCRPLQLLSPPPIMIDGGTPKWKPKMKYSEFPFPHPCHNRQLYLMLGSHKTQLILKGGEENSLESEESHSGTLRNPPPIALLNTPAPQEVEFLHYTRQDRSYTMSIDFILNKDS
ncbi:hypothetical protein AAE478_003230 [Parahypoxylon ruwenzoriense]